VRAFRHLMLAITFMGVTAVLLVMSSLPAPAKGQTAPVGSAARR
jgi:hypothetical protein